MQCTKKEKRNLADYFFASNFLKSSLDNLLPSATFELPVESLVLPTTFLARALDRSGMLAFL